MFSELLKVMRSSSKYELRFDDYAVGDHVISRSRPKNRKPRKNNPDNPSGIKSTSDIMNMIMLSIITATIRSISLA